MPVAPSEKKKRVKTEAGHGAPAGGARALALAQQLQAHRDAYYAGSPTISDAAYDALEDELRRLDPTNAVLAKVGSAVLVSEWEKARHEIPMGSLNKAVSEEELRAWLARCDDLLSKEADAPAPVEGEPAPTIGSDLFVAEKLDGISIEVLYKDGKLADAITRGDGEWGERITANVARMKDVPLTIADKRALSVRGEIILHLSAKREHFPTYASPRNTAAGTSKRFDGKGSEHLTVLFYDVAEHVGLKTEVEIFAFLENLGFKTPGTKHGSVDDVIALHQRYGGALRAELDYEIDGLVVYVNSLHTQEVLGEVNHRPRGAVAFKFASPAKTTEVLEVRWDTGPSGRVVPVALVSPVELAGASVRRASLHNAANVRELGIGVGDLVLVSRRNDVIPYVEEVVEKRGTPAEPPTECPVCGSPIVSEGEYLLCRNLACRAIVEGRIRNWIGAIGALEWGEKLIAQLVEAKLVREPVDLYKLTAEDIAKLDRRGDKSAKKCMAELAARLPLTLPVFIDALGMEAFALQTARLLVGGGYTTIEAMLAAKEEDVAAIPGLGAIKAANILRGLRAREEEIGRLLAAGIVPVTREAEGKLAGKTFCFTGASSLSRAELTHLVESNGGRVLGSVTKELDYLVLADPESTSTKAAKARKLEKKLITEEDLMKLLEEKEPEALEADTA